MSTSSNIAKVNVNYNENKLEVIKAYVSILKYNLKIILNLNVLISIVFLMFILIVFSFKLLDYVSIARIGEFYISIIGIILLPYLGDIENKDNIKETVYVRKVFQFKIIISRIIIIIALMFLMISSIMSLAKFQGSSFNFIEITFGVCISAIFLGMIGFTVVNLTGNISVAYLVSFTYYIMEYFNQGKYTKDLYLFSLTTGSFQKGKYILLLISSIMLVFNLFIVKKKS